MIDVATLVGTLLSVFGVAFAIWQLTRTQKAATAAEQAAREARGVISKNVLLADVSACIRNIEEVKAHLRADRIEAALIRLTDTRSQLIQIRSLTRSEDGSQRIQHVVAQLAVLRDVLEEHQHGSNSTLDRIEAVRALADASDTLTEWLAPAKYQIARGQDDS